MCSDIAVNYYNALDVCDGDEGVASLESGRRDNRG